MSRFMTRRADVILGVVGGFIAAAALAFPGRTPLVAAFAIVGPLAAGAAAAIVRTRQERRELDVDEAAYAGLVAGMSGGFVLAVPFPLAMALYVSNAGEDAPAWLSIAGAAASIGTAVLLFLVFAALTVVSAVIASRVAAPR